MLLSSGKGKNLERRVFVFGDSISVGSLSIPDPQTFYGYTYLISNIKGWVQKNFAVGGTRIFDSTQTSPMSGQDIRPNDRIIWLTGYNDMRYAGNDSTYINNYGNALSAQLTILSSYGCPIILGNCLKMTAGGYTQGSPDFDNGSDAAVSAFNSKISTVAASFPLVKLVDVSGWAPSTSGYLQGDQVHPSRAGANALGDIFISVINSNGL